MVVRSLRWGRIVKAMRLTQADYRDFTPRRFHNRHLWHRMLTKKSIQIGKEKGE